MTSPRRKGPGTAALLLALLVVAALWILSADGSRTGPYFLGLYRTRWFCLNLVLSYVVLWLGLHRVLGLSRGAWIRVGLVHGACALVLLVAESPSLIGGIDYRTLLGNATWRPARTGCSIPPCHASSRS